MYQVVCATTNPAKIQSVLLAFTHIYGDGACQIESVVVDSNVPEQPFGSSETKLGAQNRIDNARKLKPEADFWVAIEAGIDEGSTFSWVIIESTTQHGESRSASLPLPGIMLKNVSAENTLGMVMSEYSGIDKVGRKEGAIGIFTAGTLTRSTVYYQAVILALSPFHNDIYLR